MRIRRLAVALGLVMATAGGITAQPSEACTVPCNLQPKAMGVVLGGGIPGNTFGFPLQGKFMGLKGGTVQTTSFSTYVGGESSYRYVYLGSNRYVANVTWQVIPNFDGVPALAVITLSKAQGYSETVNGELFGLVGGQQSVGTLEITGP